MNVILIKKSCAGKEKIPHVIFMWCTCQCFSPCLFHMNFTELLLLHVFKPWASARLCDKQNVKAQTWPVGLLQNPNWMFLRILKVHVLCALNACCLNPASPTRHYLQSAFSHLCVCVSLNYGRRWLMRGEYLFRDHFVRTRVLCMHVCKCGCPSAAANSNKHAARQRRGTRNAGASMKLLCRQNSSFVNGAGLIIIHYVSQQT